MDNSEFPLFVYSLISFFSTWQPTGRRENAIDTLDELNAFLDRITHLSHLDIRDGQLWAGGWAWPDSPAGRVTAEDLTVLQRGYRWAPSTPGFSLDAGDSMAVADVVALLDPTQFPALAQHRGLVNLLVALDGAQTSDERLKVLRATPVASKVLTKPEIQYLEDGLAGANTDAEWNDAFDFYLNVVLERVADTLDGADAKSGGAAGGGSHHLGSVLADTVRGRPPYQSARYDGGLQGTEAGMTYFYTDLVGKAWPLGLGSGVPAGQVAGFVPDVQAQTPLGQCTFEEEQGRLWFGLRDEEATIANLEQALAKRRLPLVWLDCHGGHAPDDSLRSWLSLAPSPEDDGHLEVDCFQNLPLGRCSTLMLGACESGMVQYIGHDERQGFVRAGLLAGASSVLAARWAAEDRVATAVLDRFHRYLRYLPRDRALQRAQLDVIEGRCQELTAGDYPLPSPEHPARWACWTLYGDAGLHTAAGPLVRCIRSIRPKNELTVRPQSKRQT